MSLRFRFRAVHPIGFEVEFEGDAAQLNAFVSELREAGYAFEQYDLGVQKMDLGFVCRRQTERGNDRIDLYENNPAKLRPTVAFYPDTPALRQRFEALTGLFIDNLPLYEGEQAPKRGDARGGKYIIQVPNAVRVLFTNNPRHNPSDERGKFSPKYLFSDFQEIVDMPAEMPNLDGLQIAGGTLSALPAPSNSAPAKSSAPAWTNDDRMKFFQWVKPLMEEGKITADEIKEALGVTDSTLYAGTVHDAQQAVRMALATKGV